LQAAIENNYAGTVALTDDINAYPFTSNVDAVFILLGIYSNNAQILIGEETPIVEYINSGGNVYIEGGDTWNYDPQYMGAFDFGPLFGISGLVDGTNDLSNVDGADFLTGMNWSYSGENNYIDNLEPIAPAVTIFSNPDMGYDCGIAYDSGTYKTIGTSFEITGLDEPTDSSLDDAVAAIINFFDLTVDIEDDIIPDITTSLSQNYPNPFNPETKINFNLHEDKNIEINIYNIKGQKVKQLVNDYLLAGHYSVVWNGKDDSGKSVTSGVYFYKMKSGNYSGTKKMILMK